MTLNLPQTLYDLNHHHHHHHPLSPSAILVPLSVRTIPTSISRFSRNVPHLPWHILPYLAVLLAANLPPPSPPPLPPVVSASRHSFLASFDDPPEIYCLPSPVACSLAAYREPGSSLSRVLRLTHSPFIRLLSLSPYDPPALSFSMRNYAPFRRASQFRTCQF